MPLTNADHQLVSFVERIERLAEEKAALTEDIKEVFAEAKGVGFDTAIIRKVIARRRRAADDIAEEEALIDTYEKALRGVEDEQRLMSIAAGEAAESEAQ